MRDIILSSNLPLEKNTFFCSNRVREIISLRKISVSRTMHTQITVNPMKEEYHFMANRHYVRDIQPDRPFFFRFGVFLYCLFFN